MKRVTMALLLFLISAAQLAAAEELLLDPTVDMNSWRVYLGWEFPGARGRAEPAVDTERGPCLQANFDFSGESRYAGLAWSGEIAKAQAVGFWVKLTDRDGGMVRLQDATGQEHAGGYKAKRGEWCKVEVPLRPESFGNHWSGANDGVLHFPLRVLLIAVSRGPDRAEMRVACPYIVTDRVRTDDRWRISIAPQPRGGLAFRGEKVTYSVGILNRLSTPAEAMVEVETQEADSPSLRVAQTRMLVDGWRQVFLPLDLPTDCLGYWCLRARLTDTAGAKVGPVVSGLVVLPRPRHYGKPDPECYFGLQTGVDVEGAERLGAKALRLAPGWRWVEPREGLILWEEYLDNQVFGALGHHMEVLLTLQAIAPGWASWKVEGKPGLSELPDPSKLGAFGEFCRQVAERYRGRLGAIEIQNEPDLTCWVHPGLSFEEGVDYYVKLLQVGYQGVKAGDPDLSVAGIDVSGGDFDGTLRFTLAVLERAAGFLDLYTGHPYASPRYFGQGLKPKGPIANRMAEKCRAALDLLERHGLSRRMWIGELGWGLDEKADPLSVYSLDFAACIAQALVVGKSVPGVEKFLYFTMRGCNEHGYEYGLLRGEPAYPLPAALAYSTCAYLLHHARPGELSGVSSDVWRATFTVPERDQLVVVWWTEGEAVRLDLPAGEPSGTWLDSFCRVLRPKGEGLKISRLPVYWVLPLSKVGPGPAFLKGIEIRPAQPVRVDKVFLATTDRLAVQVSNPTNKVQAVTVEAQGRKQTFDMPAGANRVRLDMALVSPLPIGRDVEVPVTMSCGDFREEVVLRTHLQSLEPPPNGFQADAELDEWKNRRSLRLAERSQILPPDPTVGWDGPADLSVDAYLAADGKALYFAAAVTDDKHAAPAVGPDDFWKSDSLQIALDPENDSGAEGFDSNDREVGLVLGGKEARAFISYPEPRRRLEVPVAARREEGWTVYEAAFAWAALGLKSPQPGQIMALNFIANENDGEGRVYWIGLTPGIGEAKVPAVYQQFRLGW